MTMEEAPGLTVESLAEETRGESSALFKAQRVASVKTKNTEYGRPEGRGSISSHIRVVYKDIKGVVEHLINGRTGT